MNSMYSNGNKDEVVRRIEVTFTMPSQVASALLEWLYNFHDTYEKKLEEMRLVMPENKHKRLLFRHKALGHTIKGMELQYEKHTNMDWREAENAFTVMAQKAVRKGKSLGD